MGALSNLTTEEILTSHKRWQYIRTDRNGTRYFSDCTCTRCGGRGVIDCYQYVEGGICFECGGSGVAYKPEIIKVYTEKHEAYLEDQRLKRQKKRDEEAFKKLVESYDARMEKLGFVLEEGTYCLYRVKGDTYEIREELKELGCKFIPQVGWYSSKPLEAYPTQRIEADKLLEPVKPLIQWKSLKECAACFEDDRPAATFEWVGAIGERQEFELYIEKRFDSQYTPNNWYTGVSYFYLLTDREKHNYTWRTNKFYNEKETINVRATIKDHTTYTDKFGKEIKQTVLTRCTLIK